MFAEERRMRILELLNKQNAVQLSELTALFQVSAETIRRDLLELEKKGSLRRTHGGAISVSRMVRVKELSERIGEAQELKRELAGYAVDLLQEGDTIAVDSGSTAIELAKAIALCIHRLTVITHSLDVVSILRDCREIQLIVPGGYYMASENALWGEFTIETLSGLHADKAFLCPSAVSLMDGVMDVNYSLLQVQKQYIRMADTACFLADSSKFEKTTRLKLVDLRPEQVFITDSSLPEEVAQLYQQNNIHIVRGRNHA